LDEGIDYKEVSRAEAEKFCSAKILSIKVNTKFYMVTGEALRFPMGASC